MDSYDVRHTVLEPSSVQRVVRDSSGGKRMEPIEFILSEQTPKNTASIGCRPSMWERMRYRADEFRLWLATSCCACLSSVPSLALVIIAAVLILLLVSSIPLAFVLTQHMSRSDAQRAENVTDSVATKANGTNFLHDQSNSHRKWPELDTIYKYSELDDDTGEETGLRADSLLPPNISSCYAFGFACTDQSHIIIPKNRRCDGYADCEDGSDEKYCRECQTTLSCPLQSNSHFAQQRLCLIAEHLCDEFKHCMNGEDENTTTYCRSKCDSDQFSCTMADICIPQEAVCDGIDHCPLGDDEEGCGKEKKCRGGAKRCGDRCLAKRLLCDGEVDCKEDGGSDEMDCDCASCSGRNSMLCDGGGDHQTFCVNKLRVCDGHIDCPGGEDEHSCHGICPSPQMNGQLKKNDNSNSDKDSKEEEQFVRCADGKEHEWKAACGGLIAECRCQRCDSETAFQCGANATKVEENFDGGNVEFSECIHRSLVCDHKEDCSDGSDELYCDCKNATKCQDHGKGLLSRRCYSDPQKCDGFMDCAGGEDERPCEECKNGAYLCPSEKRCIPSIKRCDGKIDCADGSDETECTCEDCSRHSSRRMYMCQEQERCFPLDDLCRPHSACPNATKKDELFCALRTQKNVARL